MEILAGGTKILAFWRKGHTSSRICI